MKQMLADAISNTKTVRLFYPPGERSVEPHTLDAPTEDHCTLVKLEHSSQQRRLAI